MNELTTSESALSLLLHSETGLPSLTRDIYLRRQSIVGTRYVGGADYIVSDIKEGSRVTLLHEADNAFDPRAVIILDEEGRKLGYLPRYENAIVSALLDAGKQFFGLVTRAPERTRDYDETSPFRFEIDLYMREFVGPGDLTAIPRNGEHGSYAVMTLNTYTDSEKLAALCALKIINGEERGLFLKEWPQDIPRENLREGLEAFDDFTGYLPLIGHGITGRDLDRLTDAYGVVLGKPLSNLVIDTEKMVRIHMPAQEDTSLEAIASALSLTCQAELPVERLCRLTWQLYVRLERSEIKPLRSLPADY